MLISFDTVIKNYELDDIMLSLGDNKVNIIYITKFK